MSEQEEQRDAMLRAIGDCITAWSNVELHLSTMFSIAAGIEGRIAYSLLATPRVFEIRSLMVHKVVQMRLNGSDLDDWNLLYNYVVVTSGKRNQVAHATMLGVEDKTFVLEPYFVMTSPKPHLSIEEVQRMALDIHELANCLYWFFGHVVVAQPALPRGAFVAPTPGLLLRLREVEAARREEQRARQQP